VDRYIRPSEEHFSRIMLFLSIFSIPIPIAIPIPICRGIGVGVGIGIAIDFLFLNTVWLESLRVDFMACKAPVLLLINRLLMVGVAQLVEHLVVAQDAVGSSPITHPIRIQRPR
jgi:hypothetical protein